MYTGLLVIASCIYGAKVFNTSKTLPEQPAPKMMSRTTKLGPARRLHDDYTTCSRIAAAELGPIAHWGLEPSIATCKRVTKITRRFQPYNRPVGLSHWKKWSRKPRSSTVLSGFIHKTLNSATDQRCLRACISESFTARTLVFSSLYRQSSDD